MGSRWRTHCVIPDTQVTPQSRTDHFTWIGNYIAEKRPEVIVHLGDHADMPSLNSYAVGKAESEGTRYVDDIRAAKDAMERLLKPIKRARAYHPDMRLTLGNHEFRIEREAEENPKLIGKLSIEDLGYKQMGWRVHPFLQIATIDGVEYVHYVVTGSMGRPASSAAAMLRQRHRSCVMGHVQRVDVAIQPNTQQTAVMAGICYQENLRYLTPQGQDTKRGIWMFHEVNEGRFDIMAVSLGFLRRKYS